MKHVVHLVADRDATIESHRIVEARVRATADDDGRALELRWTSTAELTDPGRAREVLGDADGIWLLPGSPYRSLAGALNCVRLAAARDIPFLGTCAGMQHAWLALAHDRCGIPDAAHEEVSNRGSLVVHRMANPLFSARVAVLHEGPRFVSLYGRRTSTEEFRCSFGPNPRWVARFVRAGVSVEAVDRHETPVAFSVPDLQYFVGTLYQPELVATAGHPVLRAFVAAIRMRSEPSPQPAVRLLDRPSSLPPAEAADINAALTNVLWRSFRGSDIRSWTQSRDAWRAFYATEGNRVQDFDRVALVYEGRRLVQCAALRVLRLDATTTAVWAALTATDPGSQGRGRLAQSMAALVDPSWQATFTGRVYAVARTPNPITYVALRDLVSLKPAWAAGFHPCIDDNGDVAPPSPETRATAAQVAATLSPECEYDADRFVIRGFLTKYGALYAHRDHVTSREAGANAFFDRMARDDGLLIFFRAR